MIRIPVWAGIAAGAALIACIALVLAVCLRVKKRESILREKITTLESLVQRSGRLAAAGQLAVGLAHDINNSLATAQMSLGMLDSAVGGDPGRKYLSYMRDAVSNAMETLRRLIRFSKGEGLEDRPVPMGEMLVSSTELLRSALQGVASVELETCGDGERVLGNYSELQNAVLNIGLNARDALPARGGRIALRYWSADGNPAISGSTGRWCFVSIRDNGCGMSPEVQKQIFDPFFTTKADRGSGLGLFMAQSCVARHGGTISVRSAPGKGTEFVLAFPAMEGARVPAGMQTGLPM